MFSLPKIAVAASGSGRSLVNLLGRKSFKVACVISNKKNCKAVAIAKENKIKTVMVSSFDEGFTHEINQQLFDQGIKLIVLAGFLVKFPVLENFKDKMINIHPSLLPKYGGKGFYGMKVHEAVIKSGDKHSGATVHMVNNEYDQGKVLAQIKVPVEPHDDAQTLAAKVFAKECVLLPKVIESLLL